MGSNGFIIRAGVKIGILLILLAGGSSFVFAAGIPTVQATLVQTIQTSLFSLDDLPYPSPDPCGVVYLPPPF